jgi:hypothetical protein
MNFKTVSGTARVAVHCWWEFGTGEPNNFF